MDFPDSKYYESEEEDEPKDLTDDEYLPDSSPDNSPDEYLETEESDSEDYVSDESDEPRRRSRKRPCGAPRHTLKRPAFRSKYRGRQNLSETSSESISDIEFSDTPQSELDSGDDIAKAPPRIYETIERVVKKRFGPVGDIGHQTTAVHSILKNLHETQAESTQVEMLKNDRPNAGDVMENSQKQEIGDEAVFALNDKTEEQFLIKWKGRSYLHCTWESHESLKDDNIKGYKKVENFLKRSESQGDVNCIDITFPCDESITEFTTVERIIASRANSDTAKIDSYLCKWKSLPYEDSTWESEKIINQLFQPCIQSFLARKLNYYSPFDPRTFSYISYNKDRLFQEVVNACNSSDKNDCLKLRDYQIEGVKWLMHSCLTGRSVILADEMGLGKTVQIMTFLKLFKLIYHIQGPSLVVVPLSTLDNWVRHFSIWAPELYVVSFVGNAQSREIIKMYELMDEASELKFNVLVTTYEWVFKEAELFSSFNWFSFIIDEGHRIKNENSLLYKCLYDFRSHYRVLMTGTPLQNSLRELWSLLHFIMPNNFQDPSSIEKYGEFEDKQRGYEQLKSSISEYILRRTKKDVEKSLPPKIEQILCVDMTNNQKKFYRWILTKNYEQLSKESKGTMSGFLNIIMELKKCCNHSNLVRNDVPYPITDVNFLLMGSGKLILLDKLLFRLFENKNRVLIFSQMVTMLDILSDYLTLRNFNYQRLDGSMSEALRVKAIDHFNSPDSDDFCFLLSTKAGGLGINLVTADVVIIYDSDWNPQNDIQAQARAHRIGQTKQVNIYRLVTKSSIEENIIERAKRKMVLDHLVIQTMDSKLTGISSNTVRFNKDELALILKFGAEELFKENIEDGNQEPLQQLNLDDIMKLSEQSDDTQANLSRGEEFLSSFKVANFNTGDIEKDLDQEYAQWKNIIPKNEIERIQNDQLVEKQTELNLPPRRKPVAQAVSSSSDIDDMRGRELKKFVKEYQRFCNPDRRVEEILKSANITFKESDLEKYHEISEFIEKSLGKVGLGETEIKINDVVIDLVRYREIRYILGIIAEKVEKFISENNFKKPDDIKRKFVIPGARKRKVKWNKKWEPSDDNHLWVGVYYYGLDNWKSMVDDKILNLSVKLKDRKGRIPCSHLFPYISNLVKSSLKVTSAKLPRARRRRNKSEEDVPEDSDSPQKDDQLDESIMKKCVNALTTVKKNIHNIEGISSKDLMKNKEDIEKIGKIIHLQNSKSSRLGVDALWSFVARFTSLPSHRDLKNFYINKCALKKP
ncbi:Chromodomain-helicase-DNA-binding protein 2 [Thelohanellus kitauei]|uniref:Chromodomain-helicase-DNA-binding protein 2 n=1 Tax=Thelohanellus kitauei TaxID=669202 RepID=A0A0C2J4N5_THEKT|nr:Chromodomain-helicase-DNA-binding protein 2 [Thelohanellus kitauei]